jgi:hypothetical protein
MNPIDTSPWIGGSAWESLLLIVLTGVIHLYGLAFIGARFVSVLGKSSDNGSFMPRFAVVISGTALLAILARNRGGYLGCCCTSVSLLGHESKAQTSIGPFAMRFLGSTCRKPL